MACIDCHHKEKAGDTPKPCSACHKDTKGDAPKLDAAFHGGENDTMPSLQSCIGCHARKVAGSKADQRPDRAETLRSLPQHPEKLGQSPHREGSAKR